MRKLHICATALAAALTLGASSAAHAIVYNLNIDHCTGGCASGSPPFATVTVLQNGANLDFTVQLLDSLVFQKSTAFDVFAFSFSDKIATVSSIVDNGPGTFTSSPVATAQDGFGTFKQGIVNSATGGTTLSFTVAAETIGNLILSTIPPGDTVALFAADVAGGGGTGNTGNIGGGVVAGVPEPATWGMMLLGFVGLGIAFRQSRRKVSFA
jgi:PEP-CTERM motif-containing protein